MHALLHAIDECAFGDRTWRELLPVVKDAFNCSVVSFATGDINTGAAWQAHSYGVDQYLMDAYYRDWDRHNPWPKALLQQIRMKYTAGHTGIPYEARECVDPKALHRSQVFNEGLKSLDISDLMLLPIVEELSTPAGINIYSGFKKKFFSDEERALAYAISPYMARAARYARKASTARRIFIDGAIAEALKPALLVSSSLEVIHANRAGAALEKAGVYGIDYNGRLRFKDAHARRTLSHFLESQTRINSPYEGCVEIAISKSFSAIAVCLKNTLARSTEFPTLNEYLIFFENRTEPMQSVLNGCAARYRLTPTETEVFLHLCAGRPPTDIAEIRKTKISTVRWTINQIYAKMEVNSQQGFFHKILAAIFMTN